MCVVPVHVADARRVLGIRIECDVSVDSEAVESHDHTDVLAAHTNHVHHGVPDHKGHTKYRFTGRVTETEV